MCTFAHPIEECEKIAGRNFLQKFIGNSVRMGKDADTKENVHTNREKIKYSIIIVKT